jgi:hypothetical protein
MIKHFTQFLFLTGCCTLLYGQEVVGIVENASDQKPISTVHIINLNKVTMSITNKEGKFAIDAEVNDTSYFSYLGYKPIKVRVSNDLVKYPNTRFQLTELAFALEEVVVRPYQLTGYLDIDARNVPINRTKRYSIPGLHRVDMKQEIEHLLVKLEFYKPSQTPLIFYIIFLVKSQSNFANSKK